MASKRTLGKRRGAPPIAPNQPGADQQQFTPGESLTRPQPSAGSGPTVQGAQALSSLMAVQQGAAQLEEEQRRNEVAAPPSPPPTPQQSPTVTKASDIDGDALGSADAEFDVMLVNPMSARASKFNNIARRKRIEAGLDPLNPRDLDDHMEYRQRVDTETLSFLFRYPSHGEFEAVHRIVAMDAVGGLYAVNRLTSMIACLGTVSILGTTLPSHLDEAGLFNRDLWDVRYSKFCSFPEVIIEDARVQYTWFDDRVATMLVGGELGNG